MSRRKKNTSRSPVPATTSPSVQGLEEDHLPAWVTWLPLAGLLLWTFLACCFPLSDTDLWWHLRTGELIWQRQTVPDHDWYTFTDFDKPWIDLHWGFQLLVTGLYHLGGPTLIILVKAAILTSAVAVAWSAGGRNLPSWGRMLFWILPVVAISGRGFERPEMLSQLFLATWLWVFSRVEERPRLLWLLVPLQLVWTNCHALFILGLVVGACYVVDRFLRQVAQGRWGLDPIPAQPTWKLLSIAGLLSVAVSLINPYGVKGLLFPLVLYRKFSVEQEFYSHNIGEFFKPIMYVEQHGLMNLYLLAELGIWCLGFASFVWLVLQRRWSPMRLLLFVGFSHLAWEANRNTNVFAIVTAVVTCQNCSAALAGHRGTIPNWGHIRLARVCSVLVGLLSVSILTGAFNYWGRESKAFGFGERPAWYMHEAAKFAGRPGMPERAFVAHNGQAAVYTYHNGPERKIFMDARLEVVTQKTFERFNQILKQMASLDRRWESALRDEQGNLPAVLLDSRGSRSAINGLLQTPGWRLVFADVTGAVFLTDRLADQLKLPAVNPEPLAYPPN